MIYENTPVVVLSPKVKIDHLEDFQFQIEEVWEIGNYKEQYAVLFDPVLNVAIALIDTNTLDILKVNKHIFDNQDKLPIDIKEFNNYKDERKVLLKYVFSVEDKNLLVFPMGFVYYDYVKYYSRTAMFELEEIGTGDYSEVGDIDSEDSTWIEVIDYETKEEVYDLYVPTHISLHFIHDSISNAKTHIIEIKPKSGVIILDPEVQITAIGTIYVPEDIFDDSQLAKYVGLTLHDSTMSEIRRMVEYSESIDMETTVNLFTEARDAFYDIMVATFKSVVEDANKDSGEIFLTLDKFKELMD